MEDVAADADAAPGEVAKLVPQRQQVEKALGRMFVLM
jgi:hypothetical protein